MLGAVNVRLSKLTALVQEDGAYAARIFKNKHYQTYATFQRRPSSHCVIEWIVRDSTTQLELEPGTYVLRLEVYRYARAYPAGELYGTAYIQPSDLVPGSQSAMSIQSAAILSHEGVSIGNAQFTTIPSSVNPPAPIPKTRRGMKHPPIVQSLEGLVKNLSLIAQNNDNCVTIGMAYRIAEGMLLFVLGQLTDQGNERALSQPYDVPNPVEDMISVAGSQARYLVYNRTGMNMSDWKIFSSNFSTMAARSLMIVFGSITSYTNVTYRTLETVNHHGFQELERTQLDLIVLRARMMNARHPGILDTLPQCTSKSSFIYSLSVKSVKHCISAHVSDQFSGPYVDVILCFRHRLTVLLLDQWKDNIDNQYSRAADGLIYRSGARWMMTYLAQHTHILPSKLEIPKEFFHVSQDSVPHGRMQAPGLQDEGGYANITSATIYDPEAKKSLDVAIKSIKGRFTEEDQQKLYREIIASWTLRHPRLLPVLGITHAADNGRISIVSPWMKKGPIFNYARGIAETYSMEKFDCWVQIRLKQIVEGIKYLHGEHMIHGDLRGPNILLDADENVIIADFGLTVYADSQSKVLMSTRAGNPRWMAPEIAQQQVGQSVRPTYASDLFSFAMVCFELYTLEVPWGDMPEDKVRSAVAEGKYPLRPARLHNNALWAVIGRCCNFEPRRRGNAEQLWRDLDRLFPDPVHTGSGQRTTRRRRDGGVLTSPPS